MYMPHHLDYISEGLRDIADELDKLPIPASRQEIYKKIEELFEMMRILADTVN